MNGDMTVGQLMGKLKKYPTNSLVVMARDEEGNGANTLYSVEPMQVITTNDDFDSVAVDRTNESETFDPNNPGGNAVYLLAGSPIENW